jgi:hypothetical protein
VLNSPSIRMHGKAFRNGRRGPGDGRILSGTGFPVGSVGRGGMQEPKARQEDIESIIGGSGEVEGDRGIIPETCTWESSPRGSSNLISLL